MAIEEIYIIGEWLFAATTIAEATIAMYWCYKYKKLLSKIEVDTKTGNLSIKKQFLK